MARLPPQVYQYELQIDTDMTGMYRTAFVFKYEADAQRVLSTYPASNQCFMRVKAALAPIVFESVEHWEHRDECERLRVLQARLSQEEWNFMMHHVSK